MLQARDESDLERDLLPRKCPPRLEPVAVPLAEIRDADDAVCRIEVDSLDLAEYLDRLRAAQVLDEVNLPTDVVNDPPAEVTLPLATDALDICLRVATAEVSHDFLHDRCAVVPHPSLEESHVLCLGCDVSVSKKRNLAFHSNLLIGEG